MERFGHGAFQRPAALQSLMQHQPLQASLSCGLTECDALRVPSDQTVVALVAALFLATRPPAVVGGIWAVIVDTFDSVAGWAWSHIGQESRVVVSPTVADGNTSASVVDVTLAGSVVTTLLGVRPRAIFARSTANSGSVCGATLSRFLGAKATATFGQALAETLSVEHGFGAAIAATMPVRAFVV